MIACGPLAAAFRRPFRLWARGFQAQLRRNFCLFGLAVRRRSDKFFGLMRFLIATLLGIFLVSCATSDSTVPKSAGQKSTINDIAVFQADAPPSRQYTVIGTLKDDATEPEEDEITVEFKKKALKMGGDAIVFKPKKESGLEMKPFSFGKLDKTYIYTVDVIRFQ